MVPANAFCVMWFTWLIAAGTIDDARQHRLIETSRAVRTGMTPDQVRTILGDPVAEYGERRLLVRLLLGKRPKQWMYGVGLNLEHLLVHDLPFLNPFPLNLRIANYADKDLVIDWSKNDTVDAVRRPAFEVPEIAYDMLEATDFIGVLFRSIIFSER